MLSACLDDDDDELMQAKMKPYRETEYNKNIEKKKKKTKKKEK